mgnify:FL=1
MFLSDMQIGDKGVIKKLNVNENIKRRLQDLGLIEETYIECILKSPFNDPSAYLVRGALIAIRKEDGKNIEVELICE